MWKIEYVENKGWSMLNVGTGKYLKDATHPAMFDEPTYFTFCTLAPTTGPQPLMNEGYYTLDGRKLSGKPTQRGIYIVNGKKVVIK